MSSMVSFSKVHRRQRSFRMASKCVPTHLTRPPKAVSAFDVKIKCAPGILVHPNPPNHGKRIATLSLMNRHAPETILVVDDDSGVLQLAVTTPQNAGYKILEATCGREGLNRFSNHHADIDLVLSDLSMPVMTCAEMICHIPRSTHACE